MTELKFSAEWAGESDAGIRSGYEVVTIQFRHEQPIDEDTTNFWREVIEEFYDGAYVKLIGSQIPKEKIK